MEMSVTVVISIFFSGKTIWCKSVGKVTSKVENLVFYKHETAVLFAERFAEFIFFDFKHKVGRGRSGNSL